MASDEQATILTVTLWHIWEARNAVRNGENGIHRHIVAERAKIYVEMILLHLFKPPKDHRCESNRLSSKWTPPPIGWMMINVDAAVFSDSPCIGIGVVVRNHFGEFIFASCQKRHVFADPELAEAIAVRLAVVYAKNLNFQHAIIASDCLSVVNKIKSPMLDRSIVGPIVQDIKNLVKGTPFSFIYIPRGCNEAAHVIARLANQCSGSAWCNVAPESIQAILCNDQLN
jgi:hypothetical protein